MADLTAQIQANADRMKKAGVPQEVVDSYISRHTARYVSPSGETFEAPAPAAPENPLLVPTEERQFYNPENRPMSALTGRPLQTTEEHYGQKQRAAASMIRHGVPTAAGIAAPELSIPVLIGQALIAGGSEFVARRIERAGSDPELDTMWEDLKAGGATGALDLGVGMFAKGLGAGMRMVGHKMYIPSEIPVEVRIAQNTLGELPADYLKGKKPSAIKRFLNWTGATKGKRPFSLTAGQINAEEKRFIGWMEGIARAGIGSRGAMSAFDTRNKEAVLDLIERYMAENTRKLTGPEFATFAERFIGTLKKRGEVFEPVVAYRKYLYTKFEDALSKSGATIDGSALRRYIRTSAGVQDKLPMRVYSRLRSEGLVPPIEPAATTRRTVTNVRTKKVSEESVEQVRDLTRTDLRTGAERRVEDVTTGRKAAAGEGTSQTVREVERVGGLTEEELAAEWANMPIGDVDKAIKVINSLWKDGQDEVNSVLNYMRGRIEDPFLTAIKGNRELNNLHSAADEFFKQEVGAFRNAAIKGIRRELTNNPSRALSLLGGSTAQRPARETYDKLMAVKKALKFSAETPELTAAQRRLIEREGVGIPSTGAGPDVLSEVATELLSGRISKNTELWNETFLQPIRYDLVSSHVDKFGRLDPDGFLNMMNRNSDVPEFFTEVFGGAKQVDEVKRLMTTLSVLKREPREKSIIIQLMQAGAIGGALSAAGQAAFSDDVTLQGTAIGGAVGILVGPYALAKMLTKPELTRSFTDGLTTGARSGRFAISLRKISEMKVASELMRNQPSQDAVDFYTTIPTNQPVAQQ